MSDVERERSRFKLPPRFASPGSAVMVGQVTTASPAVGKFLLVNPVNILGSESEGAAAVVSAGSGASVPVYLVGPGVPQTGDLLVCRFVDFRWVAERTVPKPHNNPGGCTGNLVPIAPTYAYFACPNGGFQGTRPNLTMNQGTPACGLGPFPVYPVGGGFTNHHVTLSPQGWYTPFSPLIRGNTAMGTYQNVIGGYLCMYFYQCNGYLMTIFLDPSGNPFVYNYDLTWSFPLVAAAINQPNASYGANTNVPFQIGQATTTQSGNGPALIGQLGPILTGGAGTSVFPAGTIGAPQFSL